MIIEEHEIHDDWEDFFERLDFNHQYYKGFSLTPKFTKEELMDDRFEYLVFLNVDLGEKTAALTGSIADAKGQNVYFDDYEEKEKNVVPEYEYMDDGSLFFKFDLAMSPKSVLARLKEIANESEYLCDIAGKEEYL